MHSDEKLQRGIAALYYVSQRQEDGKLMEEQVRRGLPTLTTSCSLRCVVLRSSASVASASKSVLSVTELVARGLACTEHITQVTIQQESLSAHMPQVLL